MKRALIILCISLYGCISRYDATGIDEITGILVVEGIITNDTTVIILGKSVGLLETVLKSNYVNDAIVYVESDAGDQYSVIQPVIEGKYIFATGDLQFNRQYRVKIFLEGQEYRSEFLYPMHTPEIDSISWKKEGQGEPVYICVSTHNDQSDPGYYLWSYEETWEFHSELFAEEGDWNGEWIFFDVKTPFNIYNCWSNYRSDALIFDSSEKVIGNYIFEKKVIEIAPTHSKLSVLYYVKMKQKSIRKAAYDYYNNLQRNIEQTGGIFSPIPYEMKGNIDCITDTSLPVIGYVEVSITTKQSRFFERNDNMYERPEMNCSEQTTRQELPGYIFYQIEYDDGLPFIIYAPRTCLDCRVGGTKTKPDFWPTENL